MQHWQSAFGRMKSYEVDTPSQLQNFLLNRCRACMFAESEDGVQENIPGGQPDLYTRMLLQKNVIPKLLHPNLGVSKAQKSSLRHQGLK